MSFLSPAAIALAAGLTIPPLVALYFLKLKRAVRHVPSTLLWKRAVEDLQVNSPFQRLRSSLLLLLQLLILIFAAIALGKPMFQTAERSEDTIILLIDHSASMAVTEPDGKMRLDTAKEKAKLVVNDMGPSARAMVIEFADRASPVSSFDTDRAALNRKIDSIEQTDGTTSLSEAVRLAEAYAQNIIIAGDEAGTDVAPTSAAPPATVYLFSDGRIEDADRVALEHFEVKSFRFTTIGSRADNVGILATDARRNYDAPGQVEVTATIGNFGPEPVAFDAVLYVNGRNVAIQNVQLSPAQSEDAASEDVSSGTARRNHVRTIAFDPVEIDESGVVEVLLRIEDALSADDRAWTVIEPPRHLRVLLVTRGNLFLENVLNTLRVDVVKLTPEQYEQADEDKLTDGLRSAFDVVILDRHATARLPQGNYFFFSAAPESEDVKTGDVIRNELIYYWDDLHPILRHVAVETLEVFEWVHLQLPPDAEKLIEGRNTPVLAYWTRDARQFLVSAFSLIVDDDQGRPLMNTFWVTSPDFVIFMQNAVQFLSASIAATGKRSLSPGEPATIAVSDPRRPVRIHRPDGRVQEISTTGAPTAHYDRTRRVGVYRVEPALPGRELFAVNLFNRVESNLAPAGELTLAAGTEQVAAGRIEVNKPAWPYILLALLGLLLFEWIVYNRRVFV